MMRDKVLLKGRVMQVVFRGMSASIMLHKMNEISLIASQLLLGLMLYVILIATSDIYSPLCCLSMDQSVVVSLITGSLFYVLPTTIEGSRSFFGACFMSVLFMTFGGFPQLPASLEMKR